ncbi:IS110 family transposase [Nocardia gipuzkoensis]
MLANQHNHCVVIDGAGQRLLSRRVANTEAALSALIDTVLGLVEHPAVTWATDLNRGCAALLIALLQQRDQHVAYLPGRTVHYAARMYPGEGKPMRRTPQQFDRWFSGSGHAGQAVGWSRLRRSLRIFLCLVVSLIRTFSTAGSCIYQCGDDRAGCRSELGN